jgi:hypothetical protein
MSFWDGTKWVAEAELDAAAAREAAAIARREARPRGATALALVIGLLLVLPLQGVFAASSSVWVVELSGSAGTAPTAASLHFGDAFTVGYQSQVRQPWGHATCYANSTTILSGQVATDGSIWGSWFSLWDGGPSPQNFVLGASVSPVWTGGGADCVVDLVKVSGKYLGAQGFSNETVLATTTFVAAQ